MEHYYKLGFEDAKSEKEFGTSLREEEEKQKQSGRQLTGDELDPNSSPFNTMEEDDNDEQQRYEDSEFYDQEIIPQSRRRPNPSSSQGKGGGGGSKFGFGTGMSLLYIYRTIMDLGNRDGTGFNIETLKQNIATMETWKKALLGLSIFNLSKSFF